MIEPIISSPIGILYTVLHVPGTGGLGGLAMAAAIGIASTLIVHRRLASEEGLGRLVLGGFGYGWLVAGRIILSLLFLVAGSSWTSYMGALNLVAFPADAASASIASVRGRRGLAAVSLANPPLIPPYLIELFVASICVLGLGRRAVGPRGIEIGRSNMALVYTSVEWRDRYGDLMRGAREWVVRRTPEHGIYWSPKGENGELNPHIIISGKSGGGKSTFAYYVILQLLRLGHSVTVIDMTGQYAQLAFALKELISDEWRGLGPIRTMARDNPLAVSNLLISLTEGNPRIRYYDVVARGIDAFKPVSGEPEIVMAQDLSYSIGVVERFSLGSNQHFFLIKAVGMASDGKSAVSLSRVADILASEASKLTGSEVRERDTAQAIKGLERRIRLLSLYLEPNGVPISVEELEPKDKGPGGWGCLKVLDLSGIQDEDTKTIACDLILRKLYRYIQSRRPISQQGEKWFIVIDEAWRLMYEERERRSIINQMFRVVRNHGVGLIVLTQRSSDISKEAIANADVKIYLNVGDEEDLGDLVKYTGCTILPEIAPHLPRHAGIAMRPAAVSLPEVSEATMYRGAAKLLEIVSVHRLFVPEHYIARGMKALEERRRVDWARVAESYRGVARRVEGKALSNDFSKHRVEGSAPTKPDLAERSGPASEPQAVKDIDPLEELLRLASERVTGLTPKALVAACLLASGHRLDALKGALISEGLAVVSGGRVKLRPAVSKAVKLLSSKELREKASRVSSMACNKCFSYPVNGSHVCGVDGYGRR